MISRHYDEGKERSSLQLKKLLERGTGFRQGEAKRGEWEGKSASSKSTGGAISKPPVDKAPFKKMRKEDGQGTGIES